MSASVTARSIDTKRRITYGNGRTNEALEGLAADQDAWRHDNLGRMMLFLFHAFEANLIADHHARGFKKLKQTHLNVLRYIDHPGGTRIVDLAARAGVTKGTMGQLVKECRRLGMVELAADPSDKRAKLVRHAANGRDVFNVARRSSKKTEAEFARILGADRFERFRRDLVDLRAGIIEKAGKA